ncbi:uncharacterized protein B0H18DRAFT_891825 [Fomitopsis serialis]|uniref:uncharacterized protein n=1 Tax=Fomitopsis serialis TaxID=139415 RepID=UPI002008B889|nr:uncharacterized protein B0H18DRAFT_891825 [Neoantrodia serialis]KAH9911752.1 hypothetical protein B0H18DRAFT_891825 [Neoantrodia serialis]
MGKRRRSLQDLIAQTCEACNGGFDSMQGLMAHQSMSKQCAWYKKGKLKAIYVDDSSDESSSSSNEDLDDAEDVLLPDVDPGEDDEFEVLMFAPETAHRNAPTQSASAGESSSPSHARRTALALDDDEDTRVEEVNEAAGVVLREGETVREEWRRYFEEQKEKNGKQHKGEFSLWDPFDSELDWQLASWLIKEGIGQGAIDRLLKIPKFREKLELSYHNSRALLQKVDSIPDRATWKERWLSFKDRPGERHLVQFRDIIEAIKALLGNPAHASQIVYRPSWIFSDKSRKNRIYTEMWSGKWWHAVQVRSCVLFIPEAITDKKTMTESPTSRCCPRSGHHFDRQDAADAILGQQVGIPGLYDLG